jgi:hypothetical protein
MGDHLVHVRHGDCLALGLEPGRGSGTGGRVGDDPPPFDGLSQGSTEDGVRLADGVGGKCLGQFPVELVEIVGGQLVDGLGLESRGQPLGGHPVGLDRALPLSRPAAVLHVSVH